MNLILRPTFVHTYPHLGPCKGAGSCCWIKDQQKNAYELMSYSTEPNHRERRQQSNHTPVTLFMWNFWASADVHFSLVIIHLLFLLVTLGIFIEMQYRAKDFSSSSRQSAWLKVDIGCRFRPVFVSSRVFLQRLHRHQTSKLQWKP